MLETLVTEPYSHIERALPVMAKDHEPFVGIEFLVGARGNVAHGHQQRAVNARGGKLPWLANMS